MSERAGQPTSYRYSSGWRLFSRIILHPGLRLLIRHRWAGKENIPKTGGIILAPNHLSYADWPTIALFSDSYARRYPVFMIKSPVFGVKFTGAPVIPIAHWGAQEILPYGTKKPHLFPRKTVRMAAGPPVDLSAYAGQRLGASTLRAATADIMADITGLLSWIRQETPPAAPWDLDAGGRVALDRTGGGSAAAQAGSSAGNTAGNAAGKPGGEAQADSSASGGS